MGSSNTVLISGGTGLIGSALSKALVAKDYKVIILSREYSKTANENDKISFAHWDPARQIIDHAAIRSAGAIINLAGANVAEKRWTRERKKEIVDSRILSGKLLIKAISDIPNQISTLISASAIGWYGPDEEEGRTFFKENAPHANDFLGTTCQQWEAAVQPVKALGRRLVILRTGIVLTNNGGAYPKMMMPLKFRTAAWFGNGKQVISWIHLDDLVNLYIFALENPDIDGVYNAVASEPVANKELVHKVARARGGFFIPLSIPAGALKIGLGEMSIEVLKSATVSNEKITGAGFEFQYPTVASAIKQLEHP
jgi:uncharacterized protein